MKFGRCLTPLPSLGRNGYANNAQKNSLGAAFFCGDFSVATDVPQ
jgi:hypothetical protein